MINNVPPIIAMPADHDLTKENVVKFVNEHRRDYGTKLRGRKFEEKDVSIYSEETLIKMADDKNLGVTASTAKRARKTAIDDDSIQLGIAGLFDGAEEGEVVGDASPRLPTTVTPVPHSALRLQLAITVRCSYTAASFSERILNIERAASMSTPGLVASTSSGSIWTDCCEASLGRPP